MKMPEGYCRLCGEYKSLSFEHIPPKRAFNSDAVQFETLSDMLHGYSPKKFPQGAGKNSLCVACNRRTGDLYGDAFFEWTKQGLQWLAKLDHSSSLALPYRIKPLNVLKQIVVMALAMTSENALEFHRELRYFALNESRKYLPPPYHVYVYFNPAGKRRFGSEVVIAKVDTQATSYVEAEIAMRPFGYCMTSTTGSGKSLADVLGLYDISWFSQFDYDFWTEIYLRLPMKETYEPLPLDYRNESEIPNNGQRMTQKNIKSQ